MKKFYRFIGFCVNLLLISHHSLFLFFVLFRISSLPLFIITQSVMKKLRRQLEGGRTKKSEKSEAREEGGKRSTVSTTIHPSSKSSDKFLGFEKLLEMPHLPSSHHEEDGRLSQGPPENALIRALARLTEPFLTNLCMEHKDLI